MTRSAARRLVAPAALASLALLAAAAGVGSSPSSADEATGFAVVVPDGGTPVRVGERPRAVNAVHFEIRDADGETIASAYCVDLETAIDTSLPYAQAPWSEFPRPELPAMSARLEVGWIIAHSTPALTVEQVHALPVDWEGESSTLAATQIEAAAQAAIWWYTNGSAVDRSDPLYRDHDEVVVQDFLHLYDYFVAGAADVTEPAPLASTLEPAAAEGLAGERLGPFQLDLDPDAAVETVQTDLPSGVSLTDGDGEPIDADAIREGSAFYVSVPATAAAGSATVTVQTSGEPYPTAQLWNATTGHSQAIASLATVHPTQDLTVTATWRALVAPVFTSAFGDATLEAGSPVSRFLEATGTPDPAYSATGLPASVVLDATTGELSGTAPTVPGSHTVTFVASNGTAPDATATETWIVEPAPAATLEVEASRLSVPQGGSVMLDVDASDAFGNPITDPSRISVTSDVPTDEVEGTTVTFPTASPHRLTVTVDGMSESVLVEVIPAALGQTGVERDAAGLIAALACLALGATLMALRRRRLG